MTSIVERLQFTLWTLMQPLTEMQRPAVKWEKARKGEETISENFLFIVAKEKVHFSFWGPAPTISLSEEKKNSLTDYCAEKPWERRCWWEKAFSMSFYCAFLGLIGRKQSRLYSVWIRWPEKRRRTLFSELQYSRSIDVLCTRLRWMDFTKEQTLCIHYISFVVVNISLTTVHN